MPWEVKKRGENCWGVRKYDGSWTAKECMTEKDAKAQVRLLRGIEHGYEPEERQKKEG